MILYTGSYGDAVLVASDIETECPDLRVGLFPYSARAIAPDRRGAWAVVIGCEEELPMIGVFSFTDEQKRTFEWGLEERGGETVMLCTASMSYSFEKEVDGETRVDGRILSGKGEGPTAQIAYDMATRILAEQLDHAKAVTT